MKKTPQVEIDAFKLWIDQERKVYASEKHKSLEITMYGEIVVYHNNYREYTGTDVVEAVHIYNEL